MPLSATPLLFHIRLFTLCKILSVGAQFELAHQILQHGSLRGKLLAGSRALLRGRRVVLHNTGNLIDSGRNLLNRSCLLLSAGSNLVYHLRDMLGILGCSLKVLSRPIRQLCTLFHRSDGRFNQCSGILRSFRRLARKAAHLVSNYCKPPCLLLRRGRPQLPRSAPECWSGTQYPQWS